jgi:hypothetical protein
MIRHGDIENARNMESVRSAFAPGLVDGQVTTALDQDGSISVNLVIGTSGTCQEEHAHIEFVLDREHAEILGEALLGACRPRASPADCETLPVPCYVGICINFALSGR